MLAYAAKLTALPWELSRVDVDGLKEVGFSERDILDFNQMLDTSPT